jgi:hypothetical protein
MAEYYFLVEFVNRGFLGSYTYYKDKFADPIERGKVKDAEAADVREMYKMASILFRKLESIVHYRDYKCLVHGVSWLGRQWSPFSLTANSRCCVFSSPRNKSTYCGSASLRCKSSS